MDDHADDKKMDLPECGCDSTVNPEDGILSDLLVDWCPLHGVNRSRTLSRLRRYVRQGRLSAEEFAEIKDK